MQQFNNLSHDKSCGTDLHIGIVGERSSGKSYSALQRLREAETGAYLAPLRLLALEVQERMLAAGVACSMRTGEEEDIVPNETHVSSTVEKADLRAHYAVAVIDECQMIADRQRGYAFATTSGAIETNR